VGANPENLHPVSTFQAKTGGASRPLRFFTLSGGLAWTQNSLFSRSRDEKYIIYYLTFNVAGIYLNKNCHRCLNHEQRELFDMPKLQIYNRNTMQVIVEEDIEEKDGQFVFQGCVPNLPMKDVIMLVDGKIMTSRPVARAKLAKVATATVPPKLLIAGVKGREEALPGELITYEVTSYRRGKDTINKNTVGDTDKNRIRWAIAVNGEMKNKIEQTDKNGKNITGENIKIKMEEDWTGKEITVMACLDGFNKKVSQTTKVNGFPHLIAKSTRRPGKDGDNVAKDMRCGDMTEEDIFRIFENHSTNSNLRTKINDANIHFKVLEIEAIRYFSGQYVKVYKPIFPEDLNENCRLSKEYVRVNMEICIKSMIQRFQYGSGGTYSNDERLITAVMGHEDTIRFFNDIRKDILNILEENNGNIFVALDDDNVKRPKFNKGIFWHFFNSDKCKGLTLAINDTWAYDVYVTEYKLEEDRTYKGKIKIVIYDHFGLDENDVQKGKWAHRFECFYHWFVLQHWNGFDCKYKPFLNVIEKILPFKGKLNL